MTIKTKHGEYLKGGIYQHYKGGHYKILEIAHLHDSQDIYLIIYHQCDINGIYQSIRDNHGNPKVFQPWATHETRWNDQVHNSEGKQVERFKLIN